MNATIIPTLVFTLLHVVNNSPICSCSNALCFPLPLAPWECKTCRRWAAYCLTLCYSSMYKLHPQLSDSFLQDALGVNMFGLRGVMVEYLVDMQLAIYVFI